MKRFLTLLVGLIVFAFLASQVYARLGNYHYEIKVFKNVGHAESPYPGYTELTSGVTYAVFNPGTTTFSSILQSSGAVKNNPVTTTAFNLVDRIDFYISTSYDCVDILVVDTDGGYTMWLDNVTPNTRSAVIDETPNKEHHGSIWYTMDCSPEWTGARDGTNAVDGGVDTGIDFLAGTILHDVLIEVIVPSTASNISLAVGGGSGAHPDVDLWIAGYDVDGAYVEGEGDTGDDNLRIHPTLTCEYYGVGFRWITSDDRACVVDGTEDESMYWTGVAPPYVILNDMCVYYNVQSRLEGWSNGMGSVAGWGFIHYWFTPFRR